MGLFCLALSLAWPLWAAANPIEGEDPEDALWRCEQELDGAWRGLGSAYEQSRKPEALAQRAPLKERVTNAEVMFLLNSYNEASLLLSDVLEDVKTNDSSNLSKIYYYLGESNFQIKNYSLAESYFGKLIELKDGKYIGDALKRLIQIGDLQNNLDNVDRYIEVMLSMTGNVVPLEVGYAYAKSLIRQNKPQKVLDILGPLDLSSLDGVKADYFVAVALVMTKKYQEAIERFRGVVISAVEWQHNPKISAQEKEDLQEIIDLSHLSIGRVYYELGDFTAALDSYQNISHHSKQFEQALYDVTWTYVRRAQEPNVAEKEKLANYRLAVSMLDLLLGSEDNTVLAAEARLLEGNLMLRMADENGAEDQFDSIITRYGKIIENITSITKGYATPKAYFKQVLDNRKEGELGWENIMPTEVSLWAGEDKNVASALNTLHEVDRSRQWIDEAIQLMDTMLGSLDTNNRLHFLPELAEIQKEQARMRALFINLAEQLANMQRNVVLSDASNEMQAALDKAYKERKELEKAFKSIPQDVDSYEKRKKLITDSIEKTEQAAYRLGMEVTSLTQQLDAVEKWFNTNYEQLKLSDAESQEIKERIVSERRVVQELNATQKALNEKLSRDRMIIKILNEEEARDQIIREQYLAAVHKENDLLKKAAEAQAGKGEISPYEAIVRYMGTMEKNSKEWRAAYERLLFMVAYAQKRYKDLAADVSMLKTQAAAEVKWANPQRRELRELPQVYQSYLHKVHYLENKVSSFAELEKKLEEDFKEQREMLERIGGQKITDDLLNQYLGKMSRTKVAITNEQSMLLMQNRLLLAKRKIDIALLRLDIYMSRVQIMVDAQTKDIRAEILVQKQVFDDYKKSLAKLEQDNSEYLVNVSTAAFENVKKRFNSVILRADVGILDVAWGRKESRTKKITDLVEERNVQLERLRQEFGEIADEEEE